MVLQVKPLTCGFTFAIHVCIWCCRVFNGAVRSATLAMHENNRDKMVQCHRVRNGAVKAVTSELGSKEMGRHGFKWIT